MGKKALFVLLLLGALLFVGPPSAEAMNSTRPVAPEVLYAYYRGQQWTVGVKAHTLECFVGYEQYRVRDLEYVALNGDPYAGKYSFWVEGWVANDLTSEEMGCDPYNEPWVPITIELSMGQKPANGLYKVRVWDPVNVKWVKAALLVED